MKKPLDDDIIGVSNPTTYLLTKGALSLLSNITTSPGICQEPEALNDLKANGKPRPWKRHKRSAQLLSAVYEILADEYPEQAARFWTDRAALQIVRRSRSSKYCRPVKKSYITAVFAAVDCVRCASGDARSSWAHRCGLLYPVQMQSKSPVMVRRMAGYC